MKDNLINISDYEKFVCKHADPIIDFFNSGAADQITLKSNTESFRNIFLKPRVLKDVSNCSTETNIFGTKISSPILISPTSCHGLACKEAEIATANASQHHETIMVLSMLSNISIEDITRNTDTKLWLQLNLLSKMEFNIDMVRRAEKCGFEAIVITVDGQYLGLRETDIRNNFSFPKNLKFANLEKYFDEHELYGHGRENLFLKSMTWKEINWLKSITNLPIILKGILHENDAKIAIDHGINGIIVSNHGGRQLDTSLPSIQALKNIAPVIDNKIPVLLDSGIRRGSDILKAIALGADAVLIGRPILWGLSANGFDGAKHIFEILRSELIKNMRLCGISSIKELKNAGKEIIA